MKKTTNFPIASTLIVITFFGLAGCDPAPENEAAPEPVVVETEVDMSAIKEEIKAIETAFAAADNARNVNAILDFYSDDAVIMANGKPMLRGKADIQKDIEAGFAETPAGTTVNYEVLEVFGDVDLVTETGKYTNMDASGKVTSTGKYMAIWEKRDGKYVCIRGIWNSDSKEN